MIAHLDNCDLVLVEGFKGASHPKIEVLRALGLHGRIADSDKTVCAIATQDAALAGPHMSLDPYNIGAIADFISTQYTLPAPA